MMNTLRIFCMSLVMMASLSAFAGQANAGTVPLNCYVYERYFKDVKGTVNIPSSTAQSLYAEICNSKPGVSGCTGSCQGELQ